MHIAYDFCSWDEFLLFILKPQVNQDSWIELCRHKELN